MKHKNSPTVSAELFLCLEVTEDEEFSKDFLQDFKNMAACAERICKKVQDMMEGKEVPARYHRKQDTT